MVQRTIGLTKLTPQSRERLAELVAEARELMYGEAGCPAWGTLFAEIEDDAKEVGHEFIRLLMQQTASEQVASLPAETLVTEAGEAAQSIGTHRRSIETESGSVCWDEPQSYLPKSRKAFFPSVESFGPEGG